jgi:hypothetical protein
MDTKAGKYFGIDSADHIKLRIYIIRGDFSSFSGDLQVWRLPVIWMDPEASEKPSKPLTR